MQITTVTYTRLRALPKYENERLEMTAEVGPDDDPRIVYERLRGLVHRLLLGTGEHVSNSNEMFTVNCDRLFADNSQP